MIKLDTDMFCFQCEQTAGCSGCAGAAGVCGKDASTAREQDELTGALVGLARAVEHRGADVATDAATDELLLEGLFTCVTNVDFDPEAVAALTVRVREAARVLNGGTAPVEYDLAELWANPDEDVRSVKSLILFGLRGMAAYAHHAFVLGYTDEGLAASFYQSLSALGSDAGVAELLPVALSVGQANFTCMQLLDRANTETFGTPAPVKVPPWSPVPSSWSPATTSRIFNSSWSRPTVAA